MNSLPRLDAAIIALKDDLDAAARNLPGWSPDNIAAIKGRVDTYHDALKQLAAEIEGLANEAS